MENKDINICVVGCGPAGKSCAVELARYGFSVDVYEKNKVGGTCLNYGCTYINGLREMGDIINNLKLLKNDDSIKLNDIISFEDLQKRVSEIQNKIRSVLEREVNNAGVNLIYKEFNEDIKKDYDYIVYSNGKVYNNSYEGIYCLIHKDIVNLKELPEKILIIGGGTVAAEYASLFSNFGSEVVVYVRSKFLKMIKDGDIRNYIEKISNFKVINDKDKLKELLNDETYTKILAIGGKGRYNTDDYLRVIEYNEVVKNTFACGDCAIGKGGTTPISRMEGRVVAKNIYNLVNGKSLIKPNYEYIPNSIRMDLNISYIGEQTPYFKTVPNSVGRGTFFRVSNGIGINKIYYNNERFEKVVGSISMSPSLEIMPYFAQFLKGIDVYKNFIEIHPSTDPFYKVLRKGGF